MADTFLNEEDKKILSLLQKGFIYMSELIDAAEIPGAKASLLIEKLDANRFIERKALTGPGFWEFSITSKGDEALPSLSPADQKLRQKGICELDIKTLKMVHEKPDSRASDLIYKAIADKALQLVYAASVIKLLRLNYLRERGFFKRIINITDAGNAVLSEYT